MLACWGEVLAWWAGDIKSGAWLTAHQAMATALCCVKYCVACIHGMEELHNGVLFVGCSLQQINQVQEHMGLAKTFRIRLGFEEPLASSTAA